MREVLIPEQQPGKLIPSESIEKIIKTISEEFSPLKIVLFGSYASSEPSPDSDLDLLVIMDTDFPRYKRSVPIHLLFKPMPCAMDILVYTPEEVKQWYGTVNHIITDAINTGKVVYEQTKH